MFVFSSARVAIGFSIEPHSYLLPVAPDTPLSSGHRATVFLFWSYLATVSASKPLREAGVERSDIAGFELALR
jgi:hypothetical protein